MNALVNAGKGQRLHGVRILAVQTQCIGHDAIGPIPPHPKHPPFALLYARPGAFDGPGGS
jgi:hypothetical protein